jgi:hypothetical protein
VLGRRRAGQRHRLDAAHVGRPATHVQCELRTNTHTHSSTSISEQTINFGWPQGPRYGLTLDCWGSTDCAVLVYSRPSS